MKVIKKSGQRVNAYVLGRDDDALKYLFKTEKIKRIDDDTYEVFSQEAVNGNGEMAFKGDYIKIDSTGSPYPNNAEYFCKNHRWISANEYEQIPIPLEVWSVDEPMCEEVEFLLREKGLEINANDPEHYFNAYLWGTKESAAKDAVIIFYHIDRDYRGNIQDADFNFVARDEFEKTYRLLK